jgi:hypothetical protein
MGTTPHCRTNERVAQLGYGVQKVCAIVQDSHVLRHSEGAQGKAAGVEQAERFPRLHHLVQPCAAGAAAMCMSSLVLCIQRHPRLSSPPPGFPAVVPLPALPWYVAGPMFFSCWTSFPDATPNRNIIFCEPTNVVAQAVGIPRPGVARWTESRKQRENRCNPKGGHQPETQSQAPEQPNSKSHLECVHMVGWVVSDNVQKPKQVSHRLPTDCCAGSSNVTSRDTQTNSASLCCNRQST